MAQRADAWICSAAGARQDSASRLVEKGACGAASLGKRGFICHHKGRQEEKTLFRQGFGATIVLINKTINRRFDEDLTFPVHDRLARQAIHDAPIEPPS